MKKGPEKALQELRRNLTPKKEEAEIPPEVTAAYDRRANKSWPMDLTFATYLGGLAISRLHCCGLLALGIMRNEALWRELHGKLLCTEGTDQPATWRASVVGVAIAMAGEVVKRRILSGSCAQIEPEEGLCFAALPGLASLHHYSWDEIVTALASAYVENAEEVTGWLIPRLQDGLLRVELAEALMIAEHILSSFHVGTELDAHVGDMRDPSEIQERAWSAFAVASGFPGRS